MTEQQEARVVEMTLSGTPQCDNGTSGIRCPNFAEWYVYVGPGWNLCTTHAKLRADSVMIGFRHIQSGQILNPEPFEPGWKFMRQLDEFAREWR